MIWCLLRSIQSRNLYIKDKSSHSFIFFFNMKLFFIISRLSVCLEAGVIALQGYQSSVFRQAVEMNNVLPEIAPLFEKTLPLLQCLISCIALPSCLSVFASKQGETCKGYQFSHRHKTGINFLHVEGVTYYAKGRFSIGKMSKYFQLLFFSLFRLLNL